MRGLIRAYLAGFLYSAIAYAAMVGTFHPYQWLN